MYTAAEQRSFKAKRHPVHHIVGGGRQNCWASAAILCHVLQGNKLSLLADGDFSVPVRLTSHKQHTDGSIPPFGEFSLQHAGLQTNPVDTLNMQVYNSIVYGQETQIPTFKTQSENQATDIGLVCGRFASNESEELRSKDLH